MDTGKTPYILAIDIGTSSTRAILFDRQVRPVPECQAQISYRPLVSESDDEASAGKIEFDPETLFSAVVQAIDQLLQQAGPRAQQIGGVAVDTFVTNVMGLDSAGRPLTPLYTYAETRNAQDAENLRAELGPEGVAAAHNRTGCLVHAAYWPARFRWLARTQPDVLAQAARWVSIGEYLAWRFFGQWAVSYSVAAWTGLLNRHKLSWDDEWLGTLSLDVDRLSPLVDVDQPMQALKAPWANRWPALKNVPWFPAIGDGAAANIGSGCDGPQRIALTIGSTGAMRVVLTGPVATVPDGLWLYRVDKRRALLGGATTEGGNLFAWLRQTLQLPAGQALEQQLAAQPPAAHGLTILPFVAGERAPGWHDDAQASLIGFTLDTRPIDIVRAALESVAYRFALIYRRIRPHLDAQNEPQIIASGGGLLSSPTWMQIMADVLNRPLVASAEKEATSRGIVLLALESLGITDEIPVALEETYMPDAARHARYQAALEEQLHFYQKLIES